MKFRVYANIQTKTTIQTMGLLEKIEVKKKMKGLSWNKLAENLPITGEALRISFVRKSVDELYLKEICKILEIEIIDKNNEETQLTTKGNGVPYYEDIEMTGSIESSFSDFKEIPTFFINYEHFNDCTAYVPIVGDSMYPSFCSGEIIAIKKIFNMDVILWGEAYFVITNGNANDIKAAKLLFPHDDGSKIILRSSNPNYKGDTVINKADILHLFVIKGKIHRKHL